MKTLKIALGSFLVGAADSTSNPFGRILFWLVIVGSATVMYLVLKP